MAEAQAISYEALCAYGRVFSKLILPVTRDEALSIRREFGIPAQPCRGERARFHRESGGRDPLKFFVAGDVLVNSGLSSERVRSYALLDESTAYVAASGEVPRGAVPVTWSPLEHVIGVPNAYTAAWHGQSHAMSVLEPHAARWWGEEFHAHQAVGTSYFVTIDDELLSERHACGLLQDRGIVSPEEFIRVAELELLERGETYLALQPDFTHRIDADVSFYASLAMSIVPNVVRLMRSSWNPRDQQPATARHCHEIINRLVHLLRARDELARLHLTEGWERAGNGIRDRQLYHAQYAVMLACGLLDSIVRLVADVVGHKANRSDVSWRRAVIDQKPPAWITGLATDSEMAHLIVSARGSAFMPLSKVLHDLRDHVAHRGALDPATIEWRTPDLDLYTLSRGAIVEVIPEDEVTVPGSYTTSTSLLLVPYGFVDGVVRELVACVEVLVAIVPVGGSEWWQHDARMVAAAWDRDPISTTVMRLSGWTSWNE